MSNTTGSPLAGHDTARVSIDDHAATVRAVVAAKATRYLLRTGNEDLLPVLGLAGASIPVRPPARATTSRAVHEKRCPVCQQPFLTAHKRQRTCSRVCGHRTGWVDRKDGQSS